MYTDIVYGVILSLAFYNRIAYIPITIFLLFKKPKLIYGFMTGIILMSILINPISYFESNCKMIHIPKFILDYSLLIVLPVMLFFNDRKINFKKIRQKYCLHSELEKYKGYIDNGANHNYSFKCCKCSKELMQEVDIL